MDEDGKLICITIAIIAVSIMVIVLASLCYYYSIQRLYINAGYTQTTLQGTPNARWVKSESELKNDKD